MTQYTCSECGGVFDEGWTDEEAHAESVKNFGVRGDAPGMAKVCDVCYQKIMAGLRFPSQVLMRGWQKVKG